MNNIKCIKIVIIFNLLSSNLVFGEINKDFTIEVVKKFEIDKNADDFSSNFDKIKYDLTINIELKFELFVHVLFAADQFIEKNPKPKGISYTNILPPGGFDVINDPELRGRLSKKITTNEALGDNIRNYNKILGIKNYILNLFSFYKRSNSESDLIDKCIKKYTNDPLVIKKITDLINQEIENDKNRSR